MLTNFHYDCLSNRHKQQLVFTKLSTIPLAPCSALETVPGTAAEEARTIKAGACGRGAIRGGGAELCRKTEVSEVIACVIWAARPVNIHFVQVGAVRAKGNV